MGMKGRDSEEVNPLTIGFRTLKAFLEPWPLPPRFHVWFQEILSPALAPDLQCTEKGSFGAPIT